MLQSTVRGHYQEVVSGLRTYHAELEEKSYIGRVNESFLDEKLKELEEQWPVRDELFWLSVARINELALLCAGNYADNLEFTAAGDLLVNPRLILVHTRNRVVPIRKERHASLAVQFASEASNDFEVRTWLRDNTILEVKEKPLLLHLYELLKSAGCIAPHYLASAEDRMKRIAQAIGFLTAWHVSDRCDLIHRLSSISEAERLFVTENLCRFGTEFFDELGRDVYRVMGDRRYKSRFCC